jgi:hypothetical protein
VLDLATKLGITTLGDAERFGLSVGIGAGEVKLLELTRAFGIFGNSGMKVEISPFLKVEDTQGNLLDSWPENPEGVQVVDPQSAYLTSSILSDTSARGPGWNTYLAIPGHTVAAKTGTSNKRLANNKILPLDLWTVGYTPSLAVGVWSGNNDGSPTFYNADGLNVSGAIWKKFLTEALKGKPDEAFTMPSGIRRVTVSKASGLLPSDDTPEDARATDIFSSYGTPRDYDKVFVKVKVDPLCGDKLPNEFTPPDAAEEKVFTNFHSEKPNFPNWENAVRAWVAGHPFLNYSAVPTETCDARQLVNEKEAPAVSIISPLEGANVTAGSEIEAVAEVRAPAGIQRVEYFLDNNSVGVLQNPPFVLKINLPAGEENGTIHTLRVKVLDKKYNLATAASSIRSEISADTASPIVRFSTPLPGETLTASSKITVEIDARDETSVKRVDLFLDGQGLAGKLTRPFSFSVSLPNDTKIHTLEARAYDPAGNVGVAQNKIVLQSGSNADFGASAWAYIMSPANGASLNFGERVAVTAKINPEKLSSVKQLEMVFEHGHESQVFATFTAGDLGGSLDGQIQAYFNPPSTGAFSIFARVRPQKGPAKSSPKIEVEVGN